MDEELEKNKNSNQEEGKRYKHISEKKKTTFSAKKFSRFLFFIIVLAAAIFATNRVTQSFIDKRDEKIVRKVFEKADEDKNITNYYEKKRWSVDTVRETWRKDNNYLVQDTKDDGTVYQTYFVDGIYYVVRDIRDDINGVITKKVTKMTNAGEKLPSPGLQESNPSNDIEAEIKKWAKESKITSIKLEDIDCYQIYIKKANEVFFVDKSDYRAIREIKRYKEENSEEIKTIDTGVIELKIDAVTDQDVALPDLSGYDVSEVDLNEYLEEQYSGNANKTQDNSTTIENQ